MLVSIVVQVQMLLLLVVIMCTNGSTGSSSSNSYNSLQLFSRQLPVYGVAGQLKLQQSRIILTGSHKASMREVVKNLILSGVRSIDILQTPPSSLSSPASFPVLPFLSGHGREVATAPSSLSRREQNELYANELEWLAFAQQLNPLVKLRFVSKLDTVTRSPTYVDSGSFGAGSSARPNVASRLHRTQHQYQYHNYDACVTCDNDNAHISSVNALCRAPHRQQHLLDSGVSMGVGFDANVTDIKHVVCSIHGGLSGSVFVDYGDGANVAGKDMNHESFAAQLGFIEPSSGSNVTPLQGLTADEVSLRTYYPTILPVNVADNRGRAVARTRALFLAQQWNDKETLNESNNLNSMSQRQRTRLRLRRFKFYLVKNLAAWREDNQGYGTTSDRHLNRSDSDGENAVNFANATAFNKIYQRHWKRLGSAEHRAVREISKQWFAAADKNYYKVNTYNSKYNEATSAVLGAVASNEVIKSILNGNYDSPQGRGIGFKTPPVSTTATGLYPSVSFPPVSQWFLFESLDTQSAGGIGRVGVGSSGASGTGGAAVLHAGLLDGLKVVVVGAGAIGCEVLNILSNVHLNGHGFIGADDSTTGRQTQGKHSRLGGRGRAGSKRQGSAPREGQIDLQQRYIAAASATGAASSYGESHSNWRFRGYGANNNIPMPRSFHAGLSGVQALRGGGHVDSTGPAPAGPHITVIDMDKIELSNLNRQLLYTLADIGKFKAEVAAARIDDKVRVKSRGEAKTVGARKSESETETIAEVLRERSGLLSISSIVGQVLPSLVSLDRKLYPYSVEEEEAEDDEFEEGSWEAGTNEISAGTGTGKGAGASTATELNNTDVQVLEAIREADIVVSAVDNVETRAVLDRLCRRYGKWLIDGGTSGLLGSTQTIIPFIGESYSGVVSTTTAAGTDSVSDRDGTNAEVDAEATTTGNASQQLDDEDQDLIPVCSIKSTPTKPIHCILWAKQQFDELFSADIAAYTSFVQSLLNQEKEQNQDDLLRESNNGEGLVATKTAKFGYLFQIQKLWREMSVGAAGVDVSVVDSNAREGSRGLHLQARKQQLVQQLARKRIQSLCVRYALEVFGQLFSGNQLPSSSVDRTASTSIDAPTEFNSNRSNLSTPAVFSMNNPHHRQFVLQFASIMHDQALPSGSAPQQYQQQLSAKATQSELLTALYEIQAETQTQTDGAHAHAGAARRTSSLPRARSGGVNTHIIRYRSPTQLAEDIKETISVGAKWPLFTAVQYENDKPELGHVDLLTTAANIRALCFHILLIPSKTPSADGTITASTPVGIDRVQVQQVAGRVIPAVVTTTSLVSGLMTLELLKAASVVRNVKMYMDQLEYRFRKSRSRRSRTDGDVNNIIQTGSSLRGRLVSYLSALRKHWSGRRNNNTSTTAAAATVPISATSALTPANMGKKMSTTGNVISDAERLKYTRQYYHYHKHQLASLGRNYYVNLLSRAPRPPLKEESGKSGEMEDDSATDVTAVAAPSVSAGMEMFYATSPLSSTADY